MNPMHAGPKCCVFNTVDFQFEKRMLKKIACGTLDIFVVWGKTYTELANLYENKKWFCIFGSWLMY